MSTNFLRLYDWPGYNITDILTRVLGDGTGRTTPQSRGLEGELAMLSWVGRLVLPGLVFEKPWKGGVGRSSWVSDSGGYPDHL